MTGTMINAGAVVAGSLAGTLLGDTMSERTRKTMLDGLGLGTVAIGLKMSFSTSNILYVLGALLLGALVGEALDIDSRISRLGELAERSLARKVPANSSGEFARGFVIASLLFCVGPMAVMGSIQDGLTGEMSTLLVKSVLDGTAALAFSSSLGIGVAFAAVPLLAYQGLITLGAGMVQGFLTQPMINEFTATGGVLVFAIGLGLLEIKRIKVANLLPAVFIAPGLCYLAWTIRAGKM